MRLQHPKIDYNSRGEPLTFTKLPQNVTLNPDWLSPTTDTTAGSLEESIPLGLILHGWRGQSNSSLSQELGKGISLSRYFFDEIWYVFFSCIENGSA